MQIAIVAGLVLLAVLYMVRQARRAMTGQGGCHCGASCASCKGGACSMALVKTEETVRTEGSGASVKAGENGALEFHNMDFSPASGVDFAVFHAEACPEISPASTAQGEKCATCQACRCGKK